MFEEIINKILDLLKNDEELAAKVRKWYFGFPVEPQVFPYIGVKFRGCRVTSETTLKERYEMFFEILVVDAKMREDEAEINVLSMVERVDQVLTENLSLDGLVDYAYVSEISSEAGGLEKGGIIVGALVTVTALKTV
ncbi:MAG: hypothetical protein ACKD6N_03560 [Candidatus Bathyarchaeota archaeon]